jgi:hypothetical protein
VPAQGHDRLRRRDGGHVDRARQGEHRHRPSGELGLEHQLDDRRADQQRTDRAEDPDAGDQDHEPAEAVDELDEVALGGEPGEPRQERGLDRLEHEQRDARHQHAVAELGDQRLGLVVRKTVAAIGPALSSAPANTAPSSSHPRFCVTSAHGASGPGSVPSLPRAPSVMTATSGERRHRERVRRRLGDADRREQEADDDADHAVGTDDQRVRTEAAGSGAHAARQVRRRVGRERRGQRRQHPPVAVEVRPGDQRAEDRHRDEHRGGDADAQPEHPGEHRAPAFTACAAVGDRTPELLLEGRKKPGASANVANHIDWIGWNSSSPPSALRPTRKNANVATPATSSDRPTGRVPSGSGARRGAGLAVEDTRLQHYRRCSADAGTVRPVYRADRSGGPMWILRVSGSNRRAHARGSTPTR